MDTIPKKVRSKKLQTRVDLTAMVSVSFLLIVFFMVTTELAKPTMMDLGSPSHGCCDCPIYHEGKNRSLTIILGENNKLLYYVGLLSDPIEKPQKAIYGKNGIRKELLIRNKLMLDLSAKYGRTQGISVIIKPSRKSNYGNLVRILDEMKITGINSYAIVNDFTSEESRLLASK